MVMQGKKKQSKRITLSKKSKILKKVKNHHHKKAKESRRNASIAQKQAHTEDMIQNDRPFTDEELAAVEARRAAAREARARMNDARRETASASIGQKRKFASFEDGDSSNLADEQDDDTRGGNNRDSGDRAFYKELVKVIELSDVILEVLDARDPLGTRCVDMEKMVRKAGPHKHLVLLLNKIDLIPRESCEKWLQYLREESPTVAFKCSTQEQRGNLGWKATSKNAKQSKTLQTSDCLGAETLLKLLKNYSRSHEIKKSITVGIIGLPNVGKSSLINSLKRCRVVNVGATPGLTRSMQEVHLDKDVKLLDCPGVVMLKSGENDASIALKNCKRIEKLEDPVGPVNEVLKLCPAKMLTSLYKLSSFDSVDDFLQKVATARGKLKKGGIVDIQAAARIVLHDWNEGKIPYYTMPPSRNNGEVMEASIVSELGKEFNVNEVYNNETSFIGSLKSIDDFQTAAEAPPTGRIYFDEVIVAEDDQAQPSVLAEQKVDNNGDQPMGVEDEEAGKNKPKTEGSKQNEKLYAVEGMLNTRLLKADKKRRKKANKARLETDEMDVVTKNSDDGNEMSTEAPMPGIEFDN